MAGALAVILDYEMTFEMEAGVGKLKETVCDDFIDSSKQPRLPALGVL